jgi:Tfp pilus assembly protein PilF
MTRPTSPAQALALLRPHLAAHPHDAEGWRTAALAHRALGEDAQAEEAELEAIRASVHDAELQRAAQALNADALHVAEPILKGRLKAVPTDVAAIRMLAELAARIGRYADAENLLRRAVELAPGFGAARANLATVLYKQHRFAEAVETLDALNERNPDEPAQQALKAAALGRIGGYDEALALYAELVARFPAQAKLWMSYGHLLKTVGRQEEAVAAYRRSLAADPGLGEVWWSLANLKTIRFDAADEAAMAGALAADHAGRPLTDEDRLHLHFALGKAREDAGDAEASFRHYAAGNAIRRAAIDYSADDTSRHVDRIIARFTPDFLAARAGQGHEAGDVIFILGMPRAGSTLIEQILASHSMIEGTQELPDLPAIALREGRAEASPRAWVKALAGMDAAKLAALGAEYLERTRVQRKTGKPFYIDKLPNNWLYTGLIHLILPNARIIDARRHPLDCCFSNFKQHFARGQSFSYSLTDMGRYYADYVRLMAHMDRVLPGRVHRVIHEALLDDPEGETRRLLAHLGVPFEAACLRFHENRRPVRTASSEQVRRPINRDGVGQWQPFEPWLGPLKAALGPVLAAYPDAPGGGLSLSPPKGRS